jgi:hypothetical protein
MKGRIERIVWGAIAALVVLALLGDPDVRRFVVGGLFILGLARKDTER